MIWAQWVIGGIALVGFLMLFPLGLRLWRRVKAFGSMLVSATSTLSDAAASIETAQSARSIRTDV